MREYNTEEEKKKKKKKEKLNRSSNKQHSIYQRNENRKQYKK